VARFYKEGGAAWQRTQDLPQISFVCGFCNVTVSSIKGYKLGIGADGSGSQIGGLYICPGCGGPIFSSPSGDRFPAPALGNPVQHVPSELNSLYEEARRCTGQNCYTAAVLVCRKILMNIAVQQGAPQNLKFIEYVNFLAEKGFVPPNGRHWVDHIRKKGNEATHEIALMKVSDAKELLVFVEMLLRFVFEFPRMVPDGNETAG